MKVGEEDKSESKYRKAFDELKVINNVKSASKSTDKDWKVAFKQIADDLGPKEEYICKNKKPRGHIYKCDCNTVPFIINNKGCLVYSFGVGYDWSFDDAMAKLNCEVHSFDPSMLDVKEHVRATGVNFHPIGLGGQTDNTSRPRVKKFVKKHPSITWKMKTLSEILRDLGHQKRYLDILKIDIETYEWDVLRHIMDEGLTPRIRQLIIEFHIFPDEPKTKIIEYQNIYEGMKKAGFRRHAGGIIPGLYDAKIGHLQAECSYVNLMFDFQKYPVV